MNDPKLLSPKVALDRWITHTIKVYNERSSLSPLVMAINDPNLNFSLYVKAMFQVDKLKPFLHHCK